MQIYCSFSAIPCNDIIASKTTKAKAAILFVPISNGRDHSYEWTIDILYGSDRSKSEPFNYRNLERLDFGWRSVLRVRFSSPDCIEHCAKVRSLRPSATFGLHPSQGVITKPPIINNKSLLLKITFFSKNISIDVALSFLLIKLPIYL